SSADAATATSPTPRRTRATVASPARSSSTHRIFAIPQPHPRRAARARMRVDGPGGRRYEQSGHRMPKRAQAKKPGRTWWRRIRRIVVAAGFVVLLAGGLAGWVVYRELSANLPPVDKLLRYQLPVATRVYADDGTLLGEFYTEKRYLVPIARIPP